MFSSVRSCAEGKGAAVEFMVAALHVIQIQGKPGELVHGVAIQSHRHGHENTSHKARTDEYPTQGVPADGRAANQSRAKEHHQSEGLEKDGEAKLSALSHYERRLPRMGCGGLPNGPAEWKVEHRARLCRTTHGPPPFRPR